jgi:hypothetical protein
VIDLIGIAVYGHVIVGDNRHFSLREAMLLEARLTRLPARLGSAIDDRGVPTEVTTT